MAFSSLDAKVAGDPFGLANYQKLKDDLDYLHGDAGVVGLADSVELPNTKGLYGKDTGGTDRSLARIDGADEIYVGDANNHLRLLGPAGQVWANGMSVHRHPYANDRHIESGSHSFAGSGSFAVTFTDAYGATPVVALGSDVPGLSSRTGVSTTGFTLTTTAAANVDWIAEGQD